MDNSDKEMIDLLDRWFKWEGIDKIIQMKNEYENLSKLYADRVKLIWEYMETLKSRG